MNQEEYQNAIIASLEENDLDQAYSLLMNYFDKFGSDYFYALSLSDVLLRHEEYYDVIVLLSEYEDKNDLLVNERLADAYLGLGLYDQTLSKLDSLPNDDDPNLLHSFYLKGMALYLLEDYEKSLQYFEDILLETEDKDTLCCAALAYAHLGKNSRSIECLEKLRLYPEFLAEVLSEMLEYGYADIYEQALIYLQDTPAIYYRELAALYFYDSKMDEAFQAIQTSLQYEKSILAYYLLMGVYSDLEDTENTRKIQKEMLDLPIEDFDPSEFFLLRFALDQLYPELNDEKTAYIRRWMKMVNTNDAYFALGYYLADHFYSDLLNELLNDVELPHPIYLQDTYRYQNLTTDWYFMNRLYEEAYDYLLSIDYRRDIEYYKNLALCAGFLQKWDKTLLYAKSAMPDGTAAVLGIQAAQILNDPESEQFLKQSMENARGSIFDSNMESYDTYLETGLFLLPVIK